MHIPISTLAQTCHNHQTMFADVCLPEATHHAEYTTLHVKWNGSLTVYLDIYELHHISICYMMWSAAVTLHMFFYQCLCKLIEGKVITYRLWIMRMIDILSNSFQSRIPKKLQFTCRKFLPWEKVLSCKLWFPWNSVLNYI